MVHHKEYRNNGMYFIHLLPVWFRGLFPAMRRKSAAVPVILCWRTGGGSPYPFLLRLHKPLSALNQRCLWGHDGFWYSSTMATRFFFMYQLSKSIMTFLFSWNSGMTWRAIETASSSLDSDFCYNQYPRGTARKTTFLWFRTGTYSIRLTKQWPLR